MSHEYTHARIWKETGKIVKSINRVMKSTTAKTIDSATREFAKKKGVKTNAK